MAKRTGVAVAARAVRTITLGELVAAAFDVVGERRQVAQLLSSPPMARAIGRRIIFGFSGSAAEGSGEQASAFPPTAEAQ
jgi:hypothetical protein